MLHAPESTFTDYVEIYSDVFGKRCKMRPIATALTATIQSDKRLWNELPYIAFSKSITQQHLYLFMTGD